MESQSGILWRIRLFGGPTLESSVGADGSQSHFRSAKVAALLSFLALHFEKPCSREALMDALWPDESDTQVIQNRFRVTLASLRKQLEPSGFPFGAVLDTSLPGCISLRKGTTWCDAAEVEVAIMRREYPTAAKLLNTGPLLPGIYDEWAWAEQARCELLKDEMAPYLEDSEQTEESIPRLAVDHRLPLFLSTYFAPEKEFMLLTEMLSEFRLITITGTGGVGKTRLCIETCRSSSTRSIFVPLVDCSNAEAIQETILRQFTIGSRTDESSLEQLINLVRQAGQIRLVLDNAEHVLDDVRALVTVLLDAAPNLRVLTSSRQPLEIMGEQVLRLQPLVVAVEEFAEPTELAFLDRVRQSRPDFVPSPQQSGLISEICQRLEGLPLAIELAAAQITVFSVADILSHLYENLVELKSKRKTLSSRHQSLRATIESSLTALEPDNLRFLGALSVFSGGFTVDHAGEVTADPIAIERTEELVQRSLLTSQIDDETIRFSCLEIVRQLAREKIPPREMLEMKERHTQYFLHLAASVDEDDLRTLVHLDQEDYNLESCFHSAELGSNLFWNANCGAINYSFIRGQHRTGLRWVDEYYPSLDHCLEPSTARDWMFAAIKILSDIGQYDRSLEVIERVVTLSQKNDDTVGAGHALIFKGLVYARMGDNMGALGMHEEALLIARQLNNKFLLENALAHLSGSLHELWRLDTIPKSEKEIALIRAEQYATELIDITTFFSRRHPLARLLAGVATLYQDKLDLAEAYFADASRSAERLKIRSVSMYAAYFESEIAERRGDLASMEQKRKQYQKLQNLTGIRF